MVCICPVNLFPTQVFCIRKFVTRYYYSLLDSSLMNRKSSAYYHNSIAIPFHRHTLSQFAFESLPSRPIEKWNKILSLSGASLFLLFRNDSLGAWRTSTNQRSIEPDPHNVAMIHIFSLTNPRYDDDTSLWYEQAIGSNFQVLTA